MANRNFYVSPTGSDSNAGTADKPFATINGAFARVKDLGANDRIIVMPGTYNEAVQVKAGGDATGNLVLVSQTPQGAKIKSPAGAAPAINIQKNYVTIDGFDVSGLGTGHGIEATFIDGNTALNGPHHLTVINNVCHDNGGSGIGLAYGDYYLIENNICYGNCATNTYQGSGISVYEPRAVVGTDDLRIVIRGNTSYGNIFLAPTPPDHSDANGIIIDDFRGTQQKSSPGPYTYKTLVENNLCYSNGGKGIQVYLSDNVTVKNNTCAFNNRDLKNPGTWRGELSNVQGSGNTWINNIGVADPKINPNNTAVLDACYSGYVNAGVVWTNNLTFNGTVGKASITQSGSNFAPLSNKVGIDPLFVSATDFHLQAASPAKGLGAAQLQPPAAPPAPPPPVAPSFILTADMIPDAAAACIANKPSMSVADAKAAIVAIFGALFRAA